MTRRYELKERARRQAETRQRIVEAAVALHTTVGPARTTISAIAERAGVERLTVYRHFADEASLFAACSAHFTADVPPPDPGEWAGIDSPEERLRAGLGALYGYYRRGADALGHALRDAAQLPALATVLGPLYQYFEDTRARLAEGWPVDGDGRARLDAALGHAVRFDTWQSLTRHEGLDDAAAVELMVRLVRACGDNGATGGATA
jgi:AcrR family transcriptional regulator